MGKILLKIIVTLVLIPLGFISKMFFFVHSCINEAIMNVKAYIDNTYVKNWTTIFNIESDDTSWEIVNRYLFEDKEDDKCIVLCYFKDPDAGGPSHEIELTHKEFEDLLAFTKHLNKKIIKQS